VKLIELSIPGYSSWNHRCGRRPRNVREWFKDEDFKEVGVDFRAQQANLSISKKNVVRGLHYSMAPGAKPRS